jgi:hypothetical protein
LQYKRHEQNCLYASDNSVPSLLLHDNEVMSYVVCMEATSPEPKPWSFQKPETNVLNSEIYAVEINSQYID